VEIQIASNQVLTPFWQPESASRACRAQGILTRSGQNLGRPFCVRDVRFDGELCYYRMAPGGAASGHWLADDNSIDYQSFACLIIDQLTRLEGNWRLELFSHPGGDSLGRYQALSIDIHDSWTVDLATVWLKVCLQTKRDERIAEQVQPDHSTKPEKKQGWMALLLDSVEPALQLAS